jgi:hypothetical protein
MLDGTAVAGGAGEVLEELLTDGGVQLAAEFATPLENESQSEFEARRAEEFARRKEALSMAPELIGHVRPKKTWWQSTISEPIDAAGRAIGEAFNRGAESSAYGGGL